MYCNYCGKQIQDDANVCAYCGRRIGYVASRQKLMRAPKGSPDRKIAGVCAGFAEYFDLDVTIVARGVADCRTLRRRRRSGLHHCLDCYAGGAGSGYGLGSGAGYAAVSSMISVA